MQRILVSYYVLFKKQALKPTAADSEALIGSYLPVTIKMQWSGAKF